MDRLSLNPMNPVIVYHNMDSVPKYSTSHLRPPFLCAFTRKTNTLKLRFDDILPSLSKGFKTWKSAYVRFKKTKQWSSLLFS